MADLTVEQLKRTHASPIGPLSTRSSGHSSLDTNPGVPHVVLLSGGIDSAACLALVRQTPSPAFGLFVDYGQAAALSEARASAALAAHYGVPHQTLTCRPLTFGAGEIRGRNAFLAHLALMILPAASGVVVLGVHAGTRYRDCSPDFSKLIQESYDFHAGGQVVLAVPWVHKTKAEIISLAQELALPLELTYSCEAGNTACGSCLSCRDRSELVARA